jgi:hypothetical protein
MITILYSRGIPLKIALPVGIVLDILLMYTLYTLINTIRGIA